MRLVVTGGGSGGHLSPALAVIEELKKRFKEKNLPLEILFIGGNLGMEGARGSSVEQTILPPTGIPYVFISAGKLQRRFSFSSLGLLWGAIPGFFQSFYHLLKFKPDVIFATGGFVTVPAVASAWLLRIPIIIHEQTAAVGLANKIAGLFARIVAISFLVSQKEFNPRKTVLTGNPVRPKILAVRQDRREWLQVNVQRGVPSQASQAPSLYVTGGALGSHLINETIMGILPNLLQKHRVVHQCGDNGKFKDYEKLMQLKESLPEILKSHYSILKYVDEEELAKIYAEARLAISRAGANTVNELLILGIPAILIPIPWVTNNEQYKNARVLVNAGLGSIIPEDELTPQRLLSEIESFEKREEEFQKISVKLLSQDIPESAKMIAEMIYELSLF